MVVGVRNVLFVAASGTGARPEGGLLRNPRGGRGDGSAKGPGLRSGIKSGKFLQVAPRGRRVVV